MNMLINLTDELIRHTHTHSYELIQEHLKTLLFSRARVGSASE